MDKYLPLAKVQAALCGCQTQQKTIIPGKVFTAVVAKGATASERSPRMGRAAGVITEHQPGDALQEGPLPQHRPPQLPRDP